jgi:hypothetical protein
MSAPPKQSSELVNEIGQEAYLDIVRKVQSHGSVLDDAFSATAIACTVALANALGPAIASAKDPAAASEILIAWSLKRLRQICAKWQ